MSPNTICTKPTCTICARTILLWNFLYLHLKLSVSRHCHFYWLFSRPRLSRLNFSFPRSFSRVSTIILTIKMYEKKKISTYTRPSSRRTCSDSLRVRHQALIFDNWVVISDTCHSSRPCNGFCYCRYLIYYYHFQSNYDSNNLCLKFFFVTLFLRLLARYRSNFIIRKSYLNKKNLLNSFVLSPRDNKTSENISIMFWMHFFY